MITADQLLAHAVGDYILQSDWMATEKTKRSIAALAHVVTYGLPFLFLHPSRAAYLVIVSTHFIIDRWRLARFVVWAKNWLGARQFHVDTQSPSGKAWKINPSWSECSGTGYPEATPDWLAFWLLIIADNILHVTINGLALKYL